MHRVSLVLVIFGVALTSTAYGQANQAPVRGEKPILINRMMVDIRILCSQNFQGRQAGTNGGDKSARFVAERFETLGLTPVVQKNESPSQKQWGQYSSLSATKVLFPTLVNIFPIQTQKEATSASLHVGKDYLPMFDSPAVNLTLPIVFVGYGISDPAQSMDDYHAVNVKNRIALFLRGKPPVYSQWITHEEKVQTAQEKGAAAFLTVTGPLLSRYEARKGLEQIPLALYSSTPENRPIPGAWLSGTSLDQQLATIYESLDSLQRQANENPGQVSRPLSLLAHLSWESRQKPGALINVLGLIPGEDPILGEELILIGAHRDHFGEQAGMLFPGADDNASGTAVVAEIARQIIEEDRKPKRSILFVSFDGEERGLLGSKHYVRNPVWPLKKTVAMINLDHVGVGNGNLTVGVTRLDKSIVQQAAVPVGLAGKINVYGYFPGGDHVPFFESEVPTITVVSAGVHPNFHQPSDTPDTINPDVLKTAASFTLSLLNILANPS